MLWRGDDLGDDQGRNQERRAEDYLTGRLGERRLRIIGEMSARVGEGDAVATDRADARHGADELSAAQSLPHPKYDEDTEEAQDQSDDSLARRLLLRERDQQHRQRRER